MARLHILYCIVLYCNLLNVRLYRHHWKPRAAAAAAYSARLHIFVSVARWSSGAALNVSHQHHLSVPPTQRPCRTCRLTCISPATQTTHPIHSLTFRPVVGQLSEVAKVWNGLRSDVTSASSLSVFKNRLKTYLFCRCYETVSL